MKTKLLSIVFLLNIIAFSQENANNKFSFDYNLGITNPFTALSQNYYANYVGLFHADLGARYMFREKVGIKVDFGFDRFKNDNYGTYSESLPFSSFYFRSNIQGVLNVGKILHFSDWTNRIGLIMHSGIGYSHNIGDSSSNNTGARTSDNMFNFMIGVLPQVKINDRFAMNLDLSLISNMNQQYNFDFKENATSKYGMIANISVGGSYYIGKNKTHYDWNNKTIEKEIIKDSIPVLKQDSILANVYDTDKDGILDEEDMCPEEFGLKDFQGCPKPELTFDCDLNDFPVFVFNKAKHDLLSYYEPIIDSLAKCMLENKHKKIIIYGFTDDFGDSIYTEELSFNRANVIKTAIVLKGISPDRIFALGESRKKANLPENEKDITHNRVAYIEAISSNQDDIKVLESGEFLQGLFFTVQIGAYQKVMKNNKFNKLGKVLVSKSPDGFIRYSVDVFLNYEDAYEKWKKIRANGAMQDSFVSAYFLGEKITIKKAQELLLLKGSDILQK
ncbi:MAG: OmpA family protein [Flavobacteriia bacterium]|jgi:OOP family OmpA-OmpF porin